MKKFILLLGLASVFVSAGCGSGYGMNGVVSTGPMAFNATLNTGDAVNDQILKFELKVSSATLTGVSPTSMTSNLLSKPAEVEFVHEAGTFEPLAIANIPPGTYSGATFTVSNPEVVVLNAGIPKSVPANLSNATVTAIFSPAITITNSAITVIDFDLDLAGSVTLNGSPVTSAAVNPKFNVAAFTAPASGNQDDERGDIEDVHGSVTNVAAPNFTIQTNQATITFVTNIYTEFHDGLTQLLDLKAGDIVEVDGFTQADGTKLASKVSKEGGSTGEEAEGVITAVTGSPAVDLTIADQLDSSGAPTPPTTVAVSMNSGTVFAVRADKLNLSSMFAFDATHVGKGQRVEADSFTAGFPTIATKLKLREQALVGTVAATPAPNSFEFTLNINPTSAFGILSGATSIAVTVPDGVSLKIAPTAGATMLVRGLVFVNGATYKMIATQGNQN
jgi:Domain of unknown function (DUF5666)